MTQCFSEFVWLDPENVSLYERWNLTVCSFLNAQQTDECMQKEDFFQIFFSNYTSDKWGRKLHDKYTFFLLFSFRSLLKIYELVIHIFRNTKTSIFLNYGYASLM